MEVSPCPFSHPVSLIQFQFQANIIRISNFREPLAKEFSELPFSKLKKLEISIDAPIHDDRYQLYFLFRHIFKTVDFLLLQHSKGLPAIDIKLCDSGLGTWVTDASTIFSRGLLTLLLYEHANVMSEWEGTSLRSKQLLSLRGRHSSLSVRSAEQDSESLHICCGGNHGGHFPWRGKRGISLSF